MNSFIVANLLPVVGIAVYLCVLMYFSIGALTMNNAV